MGIQNGVISYRKKLGETVGFKLTNTKQSAKHGSRVYAATPANPRTLRQAEQRMRIPIAIKFYRAFSNLLDHSWQGIKYGARSNTQFMRLAMAQSGQSIPYVDKGDPRFFPAEFLMSQGSLPISTADISFSPVRVAGRDYYFAKWAQLAAWQSPSRDETWGMASQFFVNTCPGLLDGDELTFCMVFNVNGQYIPAHGYLVLDTSSLRLTLDVFSDEGVIVADEGSFCLRGYNAFTGSAESRFPVVAAAVIVSRRPAKRSASWLRTTSRMVCSDDFRALWMSDQRFLTARATYLDNPDAAASDYALDQAEPESPAPSRPDAPVTPDYVVINEQIQTSWGFGSFAVGYYKGERLGLIVYFLSNNNVALGVVDGNKITYYPYNIDSTDSLQDDYYDVDDLVEADPSYSYTVDEGGSVEYGDVDVRDAVYQTAYLKGENEITYPLVYNVGGRSYCTLYDGGTTIKSNTQQTQVVNANLDPHCRDAQAFCSLLDGWSFQLLS